MDIESLETATFEEHEAIFHEAEKWLSTHPKMRNIDFQSVARLVVAEYIANTLGKTLWRAGVEPKED